MINADATIEEIEGVTGTNPPGAGRLFKTVDHAHAIKAIQAAIKWVGWKSGEVQAGLTNNGADMLCAVSLAWHDLPLEEGQVPFVGLSNCNSRTRGSKLYGGVVYKGATLCLWRGQTFRHIFTLDMKASVKAALEDYAACALDYPGKMDTLRLTQLSTARADRITMKAVRKKILAYLRIPAMTRIWESQTGDAGDDTALGLYHAFSTVMADRRAITRNPNMDQLRRLYSFYELL